MSEEDQSNKRIVRVKERAISVATSPTTIWFASLYFFTLLSMVIFNISRVGFNADGISGGPEYYINLFLNYGLNSPDEVQLYTSPYSSGFGAWIMAPFMVIWLGFVFFFLTYAGYAYNGTTFSDPSGTLFFAFFDSTVYGFEINLIGLKGNVFYIGILWIPIVASFIITIAYKNHVKRKTSLVSRFIISVIISIWISIEMAKMTDPGLYLSWNGLSESLFGDRNINSFVIYDGHYHPSTLSTLLSFFQILLAIFFMMADNLQSFYTALRAQLTHYNDNRKMLQERLRQGVKTLPWDVGEVPDQATEKGDN